MRPVWSMSLQPGGSNRAVRDTLLPVHTHWSVRYAGVHPHYVSMDCLEEEIGSWDSWGQRGNHIRGLADGMLALLDEDYHDLAASEREMSSEL